MSRVWEKGKNVMRVLLLSLVVVGLFCPFGEAGNDYPLSPALVQQWTDALKQGRRIAKDITWAIDFAKDRGQVDRVAGLTLAAEELSQGADIVDVSLGFVRIEQEHGFYDDESYKAMVSVRGYFEKSLGTIDRSVGLVSGKISGTAESVQVRYLEKTRDYLSKVRVLLQRSLQETRMFVPKKKNNSLD